MGALNRDVLALALALATPALHAQSSLPARVRIEATPCTARPFDTASWLPLVRNELVTDGVESVDVGAASEGPDALAVIRVEPAACRDDATSVTVTIDDLLTRKTVRREVALDDIPADGRARALALAIAELLRASWAELAVAGSHATEAPAPPAVRRAVMLRLRPTVRAFFADETPPAPPPPTPAAPPPPPRWNLSAGLDVRTFPGQNGALLGARAAAAWRPWRSAPVHLRVDAGWASGTALAARGEIDMNLVSGALAVLVGGGNERVELLLGPRLEVGRAWVDGRPYSAADVGSSASATVLFASLASTLRVGLSARWSVALDVSAGQTLQYVTVASGDERVAGLRGPVLSVGLGVNLALP